MNSSALLNNSARFVLLLAAQILIFNYFDLLGFVNPFPYILFIILFPVNGNKSALLIASFFLGIIMDLFLNSGGVHAFSCVVLAFLRPYIFKFSFGLSYEYQTVKLNDILTPERFSFILVSVLIHHICLFVLEVFSVTLVWNMLYITLFSIIATIILLIIIIYLIKPKRR